MIEVKEWRDVAGYESLYEVSNNGSVRVLNRMVNYPDGRRSRMKAGHVLALQSLSSGHKIVQLYKDGKQKGFLVHRLVLTAFKGECPAGMECCHNDGNPENNVVGNLRWDTSTSNNADKTRHGTQNTGEKHGLAKLTEEQVRAIKLRLKAKESQGSIALNFGVHQVHISKIKRGLVWSHLET